MQTSEIAKKLKAICGLDVRPAAAAQEAGITQNAERGETVFTVKHGGLCCAFAIDGAGTSERAIAALAAEYVAGLMASAPQNPLCAFLNGSGELPSGVRGVKSDYFVFAVRCAADGVTEYLRTVADGRDIVADMDGGITAFIKALDEYTDYRSAGEFADVLKENLSEEIKDDIKIGVGGIAHGAGELPKYYAYAHAALTGGAKFDPAGAIYSYKEYALIKVLSSLSGTEKEQYVKTVLDRSYREVLSDGELMSAADAFFKHSLNISEASRSMYVHRNTLIYRLDKIERLTGLNIRNFNDAITFRAACLMYKMLSD